MSNNQKVKARVVHDSASLLTSRNEVELHLETEVPQQGRLMHQDMRQRGTPTHIHLRQTLPQARFSHRFGRQNL